MMQKLILTNAMATVLTLSWPLFGLAAERTITLAVDRMTCVSCPYMVEQSLKRVNGVIDAEASFAEETAVVIFDNQQTTVHELTEATASAGFPATIKD